MSQPCPDSKLSPLDARVSMFRGSTNTSPTETVPLAGVLQRIQNGTYRAYVEQLRHVRTIQGEEAYARAKRQSMAFTPAGTFTQRNNASLNTPSGCLNLDLDDLTDVNHARALIGVDPHLLYMFVSPSGIGLKLGITVSGYVDATTYRHAWLAVERYLVATYPDLAVNNDSACKDVARLCYVSWDPDCFTNPQAVPFSVPPLEPPVPPVIPPPRRGPLPRDRQQRYAAQAIAAAIRILDASTVRALGSRGTRDQQRLKASRLLGGYIAGGILTEDAAKAGIAAAVERNTTNAPRAWRVIDRGLSYGEQAPIHLETLEEDYQRWRAIYRQPPPRSAAAHEAPTPDTEDPEDTGPVVRLHKLPDHLKHHPDSKVRRYHQNLTRRVNHRKSALARIGRLA